MLFGRNRPCLYTEARLFLSQSRTVRRHRAMASALGISSTTRKRSASPYLGRRAADIEPRMKIRRVRKPILEEVDPSIRMVGHGRCPRTRDKVRRSTMRRMLIGRARSRGG
jgi:hypothetical protein